MAMDDSAVVRVGRREQGSRAENERVRICRRSAVRFWMGVSAGSN